MIVTMHQFLLIQIKHEEPLNVLLYVQSYCNEKKKKRKARVFKRLNFIHTPGRINFEYLQSIKRVQFAFMYMARFVWFPFVVYIRIFCIDNIKHMVRVSTYLVL